MAVNITNSISQSFETGVLTQTVAVFGGGDINNDEVIIPAVAGKAHFVVGLAYAYGAEHTLLFKSGSRLLASFIFANPAGALAHGQQGLLFFGEPGQDIILNSSVALTITILHTTSFRIALGR